MTAADPAFAGPSPATALLGRLGVWSNLDHLAWSDVLDLGRRTESLGYDTLWLNEVSGREPFAALGALAATTTRITLGLGIASIYARDAAAAHAGALTLAEASGGRFVMGLGVSHIPHVEQQRGHTYLPPLRAMSDYLDAYAASPYRAARPFGEPPLVVAALRQGMVRLAATRSDGVFPHLVGVATIAALRAASDGFAAEAGTPARPALVVTLPTVLDPDPVTARETARRWVSSYFGLPNYTRNFLETGFTQDDIVAPGSDRLIDTLIAWGDVTAIQDRIDDLHAAGADHVALIPLATDGRQAHIPVLEALAPAG